MTLLALFACREPTSGPPGTTTTPTVPTGEAPVWTDGPLPDLVLARRFEVRPPGPASVTCVAADDPLEVHRLSSDAGELTLFGLLAETTYDCLLEAGGYDRRGSFRTGALPGWLPTWELQVEGPAGGAYTLFNHGTDQGDDRQPKLLIVDPEGRLRWYFRPTLSATDLDASLVDDGILYGGGYSTPPTVIDLAGRVLREVAASSTGLRFHHEASPTSSGEVITLAEAENTGGGLTWTGAVIEIHDPTLRQRRWTWNTQRGVDEGWLPLGTDRLDPYHTNSAQELDGSIYANFRPISTIARIDRETGDLVWRLGPGLDFELVDNAGDPVDPAEWFWRPHAPEFTSDGRVLVYDNGSGRPGGELYSRAVELELDEATMTAQVAWDFTEEGWYEGIWGDVDRLPGGNVLITRANCASCLPGDPATTQLVEVDPVTNEVVWRLVMDAPEDGGYRAERIDGCAIFANGRYCADPAR